VLGLVFILVEIELVTSQYAPTIFKVAHLGQKQGGTAYSMDRGTETPHEVVRDQGTLITFNLQTKVLLNFIEQLNLFRLRLFRLDLSSMVTVLCRMLRGHYCGFSMVLLSSFWFKLH